MLDVFLQGIMLGVAIAAPIGPASLLCINNALLYGMGIGFATGFGATVGIACFGAIVGFGCSVITLFLTSHSLLFHSFGALLLTYLAIKNFTTTSSMPTTINRSKGFLSCFSTAFLLTVASPVTIVIFISIYTGLGLEKLCTGVMDATLFTVGVLGGAFVWFSFLSFIAVFFRKYVTHNTMVLINKISAFIFLAFAVLSLFKILEAIGFA